MTEQQDSEPSDKPKVELPQVTVQSQPATSFCIYLAEAIFIIGSIFGIVLMFVTGK